MRRSHRFSMFWVAGILGIATSGCGNSENGIAGSGGATGSGGSTEVGTGGTPGSGGSPGTGGSVVQPGTGGAQGTGGASMGTGGSGSGGQSTAVPGTGGKGSGGAAGSSVQGKGGTVVPGGTVGAGGANPGGTVGPTGGVAPGGGMGSGGRVTGGTTGSSGSGGTTPPSTGPCTKSQSTGKSVSGSGPHKVTMEMNSDAGIKCGTIYRPSDLGGAEKYPIFVWGEGGCSQSGTSNQAAMGEIASQGYFVVADGVASGTACSGGQDGKAMLDYITWAIAENGKSCSAYYQSLDTTKIAADGFSCGGLMAENVSGDSRFTAVGITSSGLFSADQNLYKKIHTPFKILLGGSGDMAYTNGERDYDQISALGIPIILFSKDGAGHGGDLGSAKGDFNTVNLAWLNWQLKGDTGATGKGLLYGSSCKYCTASGWEYKSKNIQ
jgi:hypothetical protein